MFCFIYYRPVKYIWVILATALELSKSNRSIKWRCGSYVSSQTRGLQEKSHRYNSLLLCFVKALQPSQPPQLKFDGDVTQLPYDWLVCVTKFADITKSVQFLTDCTETWFSWSPSMVGFSVVSIMPLCCQMAELCALGHTFVVGILSHFQW